MSEPVQFWLENKMSAGMKMAEIGELSLVVYREKFYIVEKGACQTKGGKAVRYSNSSLPVTWKKALKGENPSPDELVVPADDALPTPVTIVKKERVKKERPAPRPAAAQIMVQETAAPSPPLPVTPPPPSASPKKMSAKPIQKPVIQTSVTANCPECNCKHEFPLEKGKNGKPFFAACTRCQAEFAVRFVPATIYLAQVAGFQ